MVSDELEEARAPIKFHAYDPSGLEPGPVRHRRVHTSSRPAAAVAGRRVRGAVDRYDTGCGGSTLPVLASAPLSSPGLRVGG